MADIPNKMFFRIGEVSRITGVKSYVLRYWEQEFTQLKPMKRRGNRRYYQHHEVLLVRRIRDLLYDQGFTISGARNRLADAALPERHAAHAALAAGPDAAPPVAASSTVAPAMTPAPTAAATPTPEVRPAAPAGPQPATPVPSEVDLPRLRAELLSIRELLEA